MEPARPGITRRTALTAAAWSAPVIAAAVASPLASASGETEVDLGVALDVLRWPWMYRHGFAFRVFDFLSGANDWSGSFYADYYVSTSDEIAYILPNANVGVGPSSTPGWSYVGMGPSGQYGAIKVTFKFGGVIPAGSSADLVVEDPHWIGLTPPDSSAPSGYTIETTRSVQIYDVIGTPNSDTDTYNFASEPVTYTTTV